MGCSGCGDDNSKNGSAINPNDPSGNSDTMNLFDDSSLVGSNKVGHQKQKQQREHQREHQRSSAFIKDSCCSDTSSDTSSVCSSVKSGRSLLLSSFNMSESSLSISSINKQTNKKKVRFNSNKLFTSKKRVQCSVRTFERAPREDRDMLWWTGAELLARKKADADLAKQNAGAAEYLSDSFQVLLRVTDDAAISSSPSRNRPPLPSSLERIVAGLDEGYRGLERKHGSAGVDRQFHCEQTVKDICLFIARRKKATNDDDDEGAPLRNNNDKQSDENAKGVVTDIDEEERIRRFSRRLTERSQRLAAFYGKVDAIVSGCRKP